MDIWLLLNPDGPEDEGSSWSLDLFSGDEFQICYLKVLASLRPYIGCDSEANAGSSWMPVMTPSTHLVIHAGPE